MPINQDQINLLLDSSSPSQQSNRVFMIERGNMMTAINWFTKITGQRLTLNDITIRTAAGGFFLHTYNGTVNGNPVNVNLRGGSSSPVTTETQTVIMRRNHEVLEYMTSSQVHPGCPTIDITHPESLGAVPRVVTLNGRIEFKFVTTQVYVQ